MGLLSDGKDGDSHLGLRVLNDTTLLVGIEQVLTKSSSQDGSIALRQDMQVLGGISS
jgi:hypothetical protein